MTIKDTILIEVDAWKVRRLRDIAVKEGIEPISFMSFYTRILEEPRVHNLGKLDDWIQEAVLAYGVLKALKEQSSKHSDNREQTK